MNFWKVPYPPYPRKPGPYSEHVKVLHGMFISRNEND